ncbi:MAG: hypothetical protein JXB48_03780 [Candidatus Latescibacteria bacterium]|nr:hypothetical protein [Candidatus Latescibacterota bacterium]
MDAEKVAFIAHPVDLGIFRSYIHSLRPDKQYDDRLLVKLFEWTPPYAVKQFSALSLDGHRAVDARLYMVPFLPEMQAISVKKVIDKIDKALSLAKTHGCTVAAMGGFTSIVLQNLEEDFSRKHGIRITSGNTLTAAIIIRSIEEIAGRFGVDLSSSTMAVIGASGDIGSACMGYFSRMVKKMYLTARSIPTLAEMVRRCRDCASAEMVITDNNIEAVEQSDICIFVTSAYVSLFTEKDFRPGTIVCDASAPPNVKLDTSLRDDVFIYHGGIATIPFPLEVDFDIGLASPLTFYGCQLEGLFLGLHPELPCSWGRGNITRERLARFLTLMDRYPSMRPVYTLGNICYNEAHIDAYARRWRYRHPVSVPCG